MFTRTRLPEAPVGVGRWPGPYTRRGGRGKATPMEQRGDGKFRSDRVSWNPQKSNRGNLNSLETPTTNPDEGSVSRKPKNNARSQYKPAA